MKRSWIKRKTPIKSYTGLKARVGLKTRSGLRMRGVSDTSVLKEEIQAILREIVIIRDGGCWLRNFPQAGKCGGYRKSDGQLILQYEHLHTRANMASFADPRLGVCICQRHHIFWKPQNSDLYNDLAEEFIGPENTKVWEAVKNDHSPHKIDLKLELIALKQYLAGLSTTSA